MRFCSPPQLVDGIPKAIMLCLVNEVKEQMQGALLDVLYKRDESGNMSVENLLEEDADYTRQKKRCQEFLHLVRPTVAYSPLWPRHCQLSCCLPACLFVSVRLSLPLSLCCTVGRWRDRSAAASLSLCLSLTLTLTLSLSLSLSLSL
eukprot:COSAG03_NODE_10598_length_640_cov_6.208872_1_plen_146_part_10